MFELKPCPFCGGTAHLFVDHGVAVICATCGARSKTLVDTLTAKGVAGNASKAVIEAWNNRAEPPVKPLTPDQFKAIYSMRENHSWPFDACPPYLFLESSSEKNDFCWISWGVATTIFEQGYRAYSADTYGEKWRCWTRKPTEAERRAAKWQN